jgi:channel protein (hemolysin III family)
MSTLSHTFESPRLRMIFEALDQRNLFLIAATYTPFSMAIAHDAVVDRAWISVDDALGILLQSIFAYRVEQVSMWPCIVLGMIPFV